MDISRPLGSVGGVLGDATSVPFAWFLGFWPTMLCITDAALFTTPCRVMLCCRLAFDVLLRLYDFSNRCSNLMQPPIDSQQK